MEILTNENTPTSARTSVMFRMILDGIRKKRIEDASADMLATYCKEENEHEGFGEKQKQK